MPDGFSGKERETRVTALDPGKRSALTSAQGGVRAADIYEITLEAACKATGVWRLLHPMIAVAMKGSDTSQLANLRTAMERRR